MQRKIFLFFIGVLIVATLKLYADTPKQPPPLPGESASEQEYLHHLYANLHKVPVVNKNPSGTVFGKAGELIAADYGGNSFLCRNTGSGIAPTTTWTCLQTVAASTCPGGSNTQVQFNDSGSCGGDSGFIYNKTLDHVGVGGGTAIIDATMAYPYYSTDNFAYSGSQVIHAADSTTSTSVINSAIFGDMVYTPATGSSPIATYGIFGRNIIRGTHGVGTVLGNIKLAGVAGVCAYEGAENTGTGNIAGVMGYAISNGTGSNGIRITGGRFSAINMSNKTVNAAYGVYVDQFRNNGGGTISNAYGVYIEMIPSGVATNTWGIYQVGLRSQGVGNVFEGPVQVNSGNVVTWPPAQDFGVWYQQSTGVTTEQVIFRSNPDPSNSKITLANGTTLTNERFNQFTAPTINGVAGGATEAVTNAATVYIDAAPSGSNITFTNGPYALWSDAGMNRFDDAVEMNSSATVTGVLTKVAGTGTARSKVGGTIDYSTITSNNSGAGETTLYSYSVPALTLAANGDSLAFYYAGTIQTSVNNKTLKVTFGSTTCFNSTAQNPVAATNWIIHGKIIRTGATTQKCSAELSTTAGNLFTFTGYATPAETLSGTVALAITGQGGASNEVTLEEAKIFWESAP